ncbi:hypothetical protein K4L44_07830 [Halosquirtibacter laminarini]|uniref:Uncharacterized protein n=1 Tax=Halosquirtibacter laminarini TaxID=3374600 RepID=A0AC61NQD1_9BACT|nr:hypothetical protein K4L44_07830 [Prolixibacteraceae bacterium]
MRMLLRVILSALIATFVMVGGEVWINYFQSESFNLMEMTGELIGAVILVVVITVLYNIILERRRRSHTWEL